MVYGTGCKGDRYEAYSENTTVRYEAYRENTTAVPFIDVSVHRIIGCGSTALSLLIAP